MKKNQPFFSSGNISRIRFSHVWQLRSVQALCLLALSAILVCGCSKNPAPDQSSSKSVSSAGSVDDTEEIIWENPADISWIDPQKPMVALSFDDGPVSSVDESSTAFRIQNALSENGMHATFFYRGESLNEETTAEIQRAYELGFEIGNHTWSHSRLSQMTEEEMIEDVSKIDDVLRSVSGQEQFLLRPPYLDAGQKVKETIKVPLISCAIDAGDWNNASTQEIIDKITDACADGSLDGKIVLMHETYETTAEAVEYLVPYLKDQGYQIVTVSELFKAHDAEMKAGIVYRECD